MTLTDLVVLALAAGWATDCWMNGSLFARLRRRLALVGPFGCDYCMNGQAACWLALLCLLPAAFLGEPWRTAFRVPLYAMAAAFVAWLVNEARMPAENDYRRTARQEEADALLGTPANPEDYA